MPAGRSRRAPWRARRLLGRRAREPARRAIYIYIERERERERERDATREMPESPTPLVLLPDEHTLMPATAEDFPLVTIIAPVSA
jgi:hypothetical protein